MSVTIIQVELTRVLDRCHLSPQVPSIATANAFSNSCECAGKAPKKTKETAPLYKDSIGINGTFSQDRDFTWKF